MDTCTNFDMTVMQHLPLHYNQNQEECWMILNLGGPEEGCSAREDILVPYRFIKFKQF